jgi:hypothetical protein
MTLQYANNGQPGAFSLTRAVQALLADSQMGRAKGYQPPEDVTLEREALREYSLQSGASGQSGGVAIPEVILTDSLVPAAQAQSVTMRAGAREITGLSGDLVAGAVVARPGSGYVDQETLEIPARTASTFGARKPRPRMLVARVELSWSMVRNTAGVLEAALRDALGREIAAAKDHAALQGDGSREPQGLAMVNGVRAISFSGATYTGAATAANSAHFRVERMAWDALVANADDVAPRYAFIGEPTVGRKLAQGRANTGKRMEHAAPYSQLTELMSFPAFWSNVAAADPAAPQTGSGAQLFFGDWGQCTHLVWGATTIRVVEPTLAADRLAGKFYLLAHCAHDVMFGQPEAFSKATALDATLAT